MSMTKNLVDNLKETHNRDIDRLEGKLKDKVDHTLFQAVIGPIKGTHKGIIGAVLSVVTAIVITLFTQ